MVPKNLPVEVPVRTPREAEEAIISLFVAAYTRTIDEMVARYGPEAFDIARQAFIASFVEPLQEAAVHMEDRSLGAFIAWLTSGMGVGHQGEYVERTEDSVRFRFTGCPWVRPFRDAGKEKIGKFFCDADGPLAAAFNPDIKFDRTKTLMDGDDHCNHHYFMKKD